MATRNLARTVIEAGRTSSSSYGRKVLRRQNRRKARLYCHKARLYDDEELEDLESSPVDLESDWSFAQDDKLGPALRWMRSKCGQPWDDVYSELRTKFCGGGIALSHVVDTHMLGWVNYLNDLDPWNSYEFVVDDAGILRHVPENARRKWSQSYHNARKLTLAAQKWAGTRKVNVVGARRYWAEQSKRYDSVTEAGDTVNSRGFRQTDEFSSEDYTFWRTLTAFDRKSFENNAETN